MRKLYAILFLSFLLAQTYGQSLAPKREFRAVWIATVNNIDFPSSPRQGFAAIKKEWTDLLDFHKSLNLNALIVQIRPVTDAFYPSKLAPWSAFLTGNQGTPPDNSGDILQFMIAETHKRGMEFHAWLNPYRATMNMDTTNLSSIHPIKTKPEWFVPYGKRYYFNPALEDVRNYLTEVVEEILINYSVDAIHFDDYFYPYPVMDEKFPDSLDFHNYGFGFAHISDWRRHNVNKLIEQISKKIKAIDKNVLFGISPFGVWRNDRDDPVNGSATKASITNYDDLYADILKWQEEGWIDYVAPQIYWHIGYDRADFETLINWWNEHAYNRPVYVGHAAYKIANNNQDEWYLPNEIPRQIAMNRASEGIDGSIFFSSKSLINNPLSITDRLKDHYYAAPAIIPEIKHLGLERSAPPVLEKIKFRKNKVRLRWKAPDAELPSYYVLYRFEDSKTGDFENPESILFISEKAQKKTWEYFDESVVSGKTYTYVLTSVNRAHAESDLSNYRTITRKGSGIKKIR